MGQYGLLYSFRDDTGNLIAEIPVTTDWSAALALLGYDPVVYERGFGGDFRELSDIFSFVLTSHYCNRSIYLLENRNAISKERDRKRKTYSAFLAWLRNISGGGLPLQDVA